MDQYVNLQNNKQAKMAMNKITDIYETLLISEQLVHEMSTYTSVQLSLVQL